MHFKCYCIEKFNVKDAIEALQIRGGGIKSHTKTCWSTMWDCISSIARLELASHK